MNYASGSGAGGLRCISRGRVARGRGPPGDGLGRCSVVDRQARLLERDLRALAGLRVVGLRVVGLRVVGLRVVDLCVVDLRVVEVLGRWIAERLLLVSQSFFLALHDLFLASHKLFLASQALFE